MCAERHSRRGAITLIGAGLLVPGLARATAPEPEELAAGADPGQRLTTPVWIDGRGPYAFVVDTGANHSVVAEDIARALGLARSGEMLVNTIAGAQQTPMAAARAFGIGSSKGGPIRLGIASRTAIGGDGLLGLDQLENLRLGLNFRDRRLTLGPSGRRLADRTAFRVAARQRSGQLTLVGAEVSGMPVIAFVDSGSEATIGNLALRRAVAAQPVVDTSSRAPVMGATGLTITGQEAYLPSLAIGGLRFRRLPVIFADLHTFRFWGIANEPALVIGVDLLRRFEAVDLDFGRGEVLFRVPGSSPIGPGSRLRGSGASAQIIRGGG